MFTTFQLNIQNFCLILPKEHLEFETPTWNIGKNMSLLYQSGRMCDTLVICTPAIRVCSLNHRPTPCGQDIPIIALSNATSGDLEILYRFIKHFL